MNSIQGSGSWEEFTRLANVAKVRNAGFNLPVVRGNTGSTKAAEKDMKSVNVVSLQNSKMYSVKKPVKHKSIIGTRFDAYA